MEDCSDRGPTGRWPHGTDVSMLKNRRADRTRISLLMDLIEKNERSISLDEQRDDLTRWADGRRIEQ